MSKAMQLIGIILLGIFTLVIINVMNDVRSTDELNYYLLQEVTEAAMYDAVDYSYYRETGLLKVDRDMFLENFNRRFAESVSANREYQIKIIDFNETPPKVSVEVTAPTVATVKGEVALITNRVNGIIETIYDDYVYSIGDYDSDKYDESKPTVLFEEIDNTTYKVKINDDLYLKGYKVVKINNSNKNSAESLCTSDGEWENPSRWPNSIVFTQKLELTDTGFWIAVMDGAGNCTVKALSDINPWLTLTYDEIPSNTDLVATLYDDHGLSKYYIAPSSWSVNDVIKNCSNNNKCKSYNIDQKSVKVDTDGYYYYKFSTKLNKLGLDYGNYKLFVVDNKGRTVSSDNILKLKQSHKPSIVYKYDATSETKGDLTLTFKDSGNDLYGYRYSTSSDNPVNDTDYKQNWSNSDGGKSITLKNVVEGTYYIWARDNQKEYTKMKLVIDLEKIDIKTNKYCAANGTLNSSTGKCDYTSNRDQCGPWEKDPCATGDPGGVCVPKDVWTKNGCSHYVTAYGSNGNGTMFTSGMTCNIYCQNLRNCRITDDTHDKCTAYGCQHRCQWVYEKLEKYDCYVTNPCESKTPNTCVEGYKYPAGSCSKDPSVATDYKCPNGYENSNGKACKKVTAS